MAASEHQRDEGPDSPLVAEARRHSVKPWLRGVVTGLHFGFLVGAAFGVSLSRYSSNRSLGLWVLLAVLGLSMPLHLLRSLLRPMPSEMAARAARWARLFGPGGRRALKTVSFPLLGIGLILMASTLLFGWPDPWWNWVLPFLVGIALLAPVAAGEKPRGITSADWERLLRGGRGGDGNDRGRADDGTDAVGRLPGHELN